MKNILIALSLVACASPALAYYGQYNYGMGCTNYQSPSIIQPVGPCGNFPTYSLTYPSMSSFGPQQTYYGGNGVHGWASTYPSNGIGPSTTYYTGF